MNETVLKNFEILIREAFAETPRLDPNRGPTLKAECVKEADFGKHWWELSPAFVNTECAYSLSESDFLFYLPLFMIATLRYEWCVRSPLLERLYTEDPVTEDRSTEWWDRFNEWDRLMHRLSSIQKHAIRLWLELLVKTYAPNGGAEKESIEHMLANCWSQF